MAMTSLPILFVLQSYPGGLYMCTVEQGLVRFRESNIFSPRAKFAADKSKTGDASLVHIRSCFNNKYWVPHEIEQGVFRILASAKKPQEDTSDPECTLFRVSNHVSSQGAPGFRFFSISKSLYASVYDDFTLNDNPYDLETTFPAVDWERLVILPDHPVAFRSEDLEGGNNYLCSRVLDRHYNYHRFESGVKIGDPGVAGHELIVNRDGTYLIKDLFFGKFWRGSPNWIWADLEQLPWGSSTWTSADVDADHLACFFSFVKRSDNKAIAIRSLGNNKYCGPDTREGKTNCLRAEYPELSRQTWLIIEERVLEKKISNVKYRLADSMTHDEEVQMVAYLIATNDSPDKEATATLEVSQTESITYTWNNSESVTTGASLSAGFEVDEIPFVAKTTMQVELSTEIGTSHEWGETKGKETTTKATYAVSVPALTTMKITLMVSKGACDVPFNYTETVRLPNGEWVSKEKDDGIYKGINTLGFHMNSSKIDYKPGQGTAVVPGQENLIVMNK